MENSNLKSVPTLLSQSAQGMDIIIVSTNTLQQADFWQKRLRELKGVICKPDAFVIAIDEDWPGGAGNGLGSLYAYQKAQEKAKFMYRTDLYGMQKKGASVAIYHTAGLGKRLFPIAASELNDKSSVKLPGTIGKRNLTILEAVIAQTNRLADKRKGRLSVFWGDQVFIPSKNFSEICSHHIEILCKGIDISTQSDWEALDLSNYGILKVCEGGKFKLLDKITFEEFLLHSSQDKNQQDGGLNASLGSFSLSPQMTFALLREFQNELEEKKGKMDSDPHFWMPLTLDQMSYLDLMNAKGVSRNQACKHYKRMEDFKTKFFRLHSEKNFFSPVNLGSQSYWWDYGSTKSYYSNLLKLTSPSHEGQAMKLYYKIDPVNQFENYNRVITDSHSCLVNCNIRSGKITNSILIGVNASSLEASNCVIINSDFSSVHARHSLFYNVLECREIKFSPGTIRADLALPKSKKRITLYTHQGRDSKADWHARLPQNPVSFDQAYRIIHSEM